MDLWVVFLMCRITLLSSIYIAKHPIARWMGLQGKRPKGRAIRRMDDKHCEYVDADCATRQKLARMTNKTRVEIRMDGLEYDRTGQDRTGEGKSS